MMRKDGPHDIGRTDTLLPHCNRMTTAAKSSPRVSVYITNHNYGQYLQQSIESVLRQTYDDYELIVIDDGSVDASREVLKQYSNHQRITTILQENKGLTTTNNIALHVARGEFIIRLDADDYFDRNALRVLTDAFSADPEVGMVFPDYYLVDENGEVIELVRRHNFERVTLQDQPAHGAGTMIRRIFLVELGGYNEALTCQDGYELWVRFIEHYKVKNVNLPLFYYRQHPDSLTTKKDEVLRAREKLLEQASAVKREKLVTVGVVAVRGQSYDRNSLPLRKLGEKALIDWTIDELFQCRKINKIVVTTPDLQVIEHLFKTYGDSIDIFPREPDLALPNTRLDATVRFVLERLSSNGYQPSAMMLLPIETPFRRARSIDMAVDVMEVFNSDSVLAVKPESDVLFSHNGHGLNSIRETAELRLERDEVYRDVGLLRLGRVRYFGNNGKLIGGRVGHIIVEGKDTLKVEDSLTWKIAEFLVEEGSETIC